MADSNYWDVLMSKMETEVERRLQHDGPRLRGGETAPFQRQLSAKDEQYHVWDVLDGSRPSTPEEQQFAWDIVRHNLEQAQREAQHG